MMDRKKREEIEVIKNCLRMHEEVVKQNMAEVKRLKRKLDKLVKGDVP